MAVRRKCFIWLAILLFSALLIVGMLWYSRHYIELYRLPEGKNGVIDLQNIDFSATPCLPLTDGWVFYPDTLIVSDYPQSLPETQSVRFPEYWKSCNRGSYVLTTTGFPSDWNLHIYIPGQRTKYRIYWNQYMVTANQISGTGGTFSNVPTQLNRLPIPYNYQGSIVIEVEGDPFCAVGTAPVMTTAENYNKNVSVNNTVVGLSCGAVLFCLVLYVALCTAGPAFKSYQLLSLLILCLICCFVRNSTGNLISHLVSASVSNSFAQFVLMAPYFAGPLLMSFNLQQIKYPLMREEKKPFIFLCLSGTLLTFLGIIVPQAAEALLLPCAIVWLLEVLILLNYLRRCIVAKCPYALLLTSGESCLLLGLCIDALAFRGIFVFQTAMWFPLLTVVMLLMLIALYTRKIMYLQQQARKAQESEIAMVRLRLENQQSKAALMLSQMRPHFLCNALLSIYDVNLENHEKANQAIIQFANYLRGSLLSIGAEGPIPFEQELNHIENYVAIEKLRFEDRLDMQYEIEYTDFFVPPLTVQPFVENAIKHGICKQLNGGTVKLKTWADETSVHILIEDNGVGFQADLKTAPESVGIKNVRTRLRTIEGASLRVESMPSNGTKVFITLPKGSN